MKNRRNYYRILQVQPDAPTEVIRASYRILMREMKKHPDLGGSTWDAEVLNEAYETLSDPQKRAVYDKVLFARYAKQTTACSKQPIAPVLCPFCKRPLSGKSKPGKLCPVCHTPLQSEELHEPARVSPRSIDRIKKEQQIHYYSAWPGKPVQGRMVDFSLKGMRFLCQEKLEPQTVLKISSRLFEASGRVTNASEEKWEGKKLYAIGVCFLAVRFEELCGTFLSTSA